MWLTARTNAGAVTAPMPGPCCAASECVRDSANGRSSSHVLELDEQGLVRIPTSVDPLESVAEADNNSPILKQVAHERYGEVGRITANWEPHGQAIKKWDDDLVVRLRVIRTTAKQCGQQDHRCWIWSSIVRAPDIGCPDGLRWKNKIDALCVLLNHAVEGHLSVSQKAKHEVPASEHHPPGIDMDLMLLSFADERVVRATVGGVPVRVFLADPVNHRPTVLLCLFDKAINSGLGHRSMVEAVQVRVSDKQKLLRFDLVDRTVRGRHDRRLRETCHVDGDSSF